MEICCRRSSRQRFRFALLWLLLLVSSRASCMTEADFAVKEKNVLRLADDALRLASDTEDCGKVPLTSSHDLER